MSNTNRVIMGTAALFLASLVGTGGYYGYKAVASPTVQVTTAKKSAPPLVVPSAVTTGVPVVPTVVPTVPAVVQSVKKTTPIAEYMPILSQPVDMVPSNDGYVHVAPRIQMYNEKPMLYFNPASIQESKAGHYSQYSFKIRDAKGTEIVPEIMSPIGEDTKVPVTKQLREALDNGARFEVVALEEVNGEFKPRASYRNGKFDKVPTETKPLLESIVSSNFGTNTYANNFGTISSTSRPTYLFASQSTPDRIASEYLNPTPVKSYVQMRGFNVEKQPYFS